MPLDLGPSVQRARLVYEISGLGQINRFTVVMIGSGSANHLAVCFVRPDDDRDRFDGRQWIRTLCGRPIWTEGAIVAAYVDGIPACRPCNVGGYAHMGPHFRTHPGEVLEGLARRDPDYLARADVFLDPPLNTSATTRKR